MRRPERTWGWCLSPLYDWNQVPPKAVQAALRELFERWGLPERLRVDNGWPWGSSSDLPTPLTLWLIGLGVGVIHNRARCPQDNSKVERFQGLIEPWAEPGTCQDFATWQERLVWVSQVQRESYPAIDKQTRLAAFPQLAARLRPYESGQEAERWDFEGVKAYLAQGVWVRQVDKIGRVTLYRRPYSVGRPYKGRQIFVHFDPEALTWVFRDANGHEIRRRPAQEITVESIRNLQISGQRSVPSVAKSDTQS